MEIKLTGKYSIPPGILFVTIPQHVLGIGFGAYLIYSGKASASWLLLAYVAWVFIGVMGVGIFYHKYLCHRAFETYAWVEAIGVYFGVLAGVGSPVGWAGLHNDHHHRHADRNEIDVHSPIHGKFHSYIGWQFKKFTFKLETAKRLLRNPRLKFFNQYYLLIYWATVALAFLIHPYLPVFLIFIPGCAQFQVESLTACFGHLKNYGYRNFETRDNSVNLLWFGILSWGTGFHNNHHGRLNAAHYQVKFYEVDLSRLLLMIIPMKKYDLNEVPTTAEL